MPDHQPPSFAPDSPPDLDSRDVRQPIDPSTLDDLRIAVVRARNAGRVDGAREERARAEKLIEQRLRAPFGLENARVELGNVLAAIRSGEPVPNT